MFEEHWTEYYGTYNDRNQTVATKVRDFLNKHEAQKVQMLYTGTIPPWLIQPPNTDDSLSRSCTKQESSDIQLALSKALIEKYNDHLCIYTDASKTADGKVGIGCYIQSSQSSTEMKLSYRITDNVSI